MTIEPGPELDKLVAEARGWIDYTLPFFEGNYLPEDSNKKHYFVVDAFIQHYPPGEEEPEYLQFSTSISDAWELVLEADGYEIQSINLSGQTGCNLIFKNSESGFQKGITAQHCICLAYVKIKGKK